MPPRASVPQKRPRETPPPAARKPPILSEPERAVLDALRRRKEAGALKTDLTQETRIPQNVFAKAIKSLTAKGLAKEVVDARNPSNPRLKRLLAAEFEPSDEITGGTWYANGALDTGLIANLRQVCLQFVRQKGVATVGMIANAVNGSGAFNMEVNRGQIMDIINSLVLDKEIDECKSSGVGEFAFVKEGDTCYRVSRGKGGGPLAGALAAIPCGVCPRISECTLDGVISPRTCVYYDKWLDSVDF